MSLEERFIGSDILYTYNVVGTDCNNFIHQLERITVRKQFTDTVYVHDGSFVAVIDRGLDFMLADFFSQLAGKLVVDRMSRTGCDDTSFDWFSCQCQVTNDIQQFVTCRFIGPYQRNMVDISQVGSIHVRNSHYVSQFVKVILCHLFFVDNNGIVQVTSFDQACIQQRLDFTHKHKGACRCYFRWEVLHIFQCRILIGQNLGVIGNQCVYTKFIVWKNDDG